MVAGKRVFRVLLPMALVLLAVPLLAQQVGEITGRVTGSDGSALPGVTVEARSNVLPQPRVTTTSENGEYRLPVLPPGSYALTFSLAGMQPATRNVQVLLNQSATINVSLGLQGVSESITVTAEASLVDPDSTALKSAVDEQLIEGIPLGQEFRDLVKLAPAVQYTEDAIRGPSAGGSGQDNVYQFDGVNVTLPLFGTLAAEPSSHDIEQVSIIKGGAQALDFNRAAGFTIDSVSKSGTNQFKGTVQYQFQTDSMRGDPADKTLQTFDQDRDWTTANFGGPILPDRVFFYTSYYRPTVTRTGRVNLYGDLPDYESTRNEYFGKLTITPVSSLLFNLSYRDSDREAKNASIGSASTPAQPSTALNDQATQKIAIGEGSWVLNDKSFVTFKYTDYKLDTASVPNNVVDFVPPTAVGTQLDVNNLEKYGLFAVPSIISGQAAYNTFITPIIDRYGYVLNGVRTGGGEVGVGSTINKQNFGRKVAQAAYDFTFGSRLQHNLHVGYQRSKDFEDLARSSNGFGVISVPGGRTNCSATACGTSQPIYYQLQFTRSQLGGIGGNNIHSEYQSQNVEINDNIHWNNWAFNVGVIVSNDELFGQGLRKDKSTISGFVAAPGHKYKMYEIPWEKTVQPRLGLTWAYNGVDNVYASYAKYVPAASSLPRAASWDRSILGLTTRVYFDKDGKLIGSEQLASSSGKLFVDDLDPRYTDEFLVGTSQQIRNNWSARAYARYRFSTNFWEDTNNDAAQRWAPAGYKKDLYIPDLAAKRAQIGSGSSYVIAELENAFSKYYEVTFESDWRGAKTSLKSSYTWSHYYGTFDQDNTSLDSNDASIFIGSSNIGDGAGLQMWDNKYGNLRGDRRHLLKVYGTYALPWTGGTLGAFAIYQSGQPWEAWSYEPYQGLPGFSGLNDVNRYAEPAGTRHAPAHYQLDLTYTHDISFLSRYGLQFQVDAFNVLNKRTGYNFEPSVHRTTTAVKFGEPRDYFDPRRYQASVKLSF